ncbi:MAG: YceK/YidQ family lipoprotein [Ectothiorhodospiraceae bacterium]|nr:YceK/YidQ family lipoprotein [Ectothiorhodospiraceae bacterium]
MTRIIIFILALQLLLQGCSTVATLSANEDNFKCDPPFKIPRAYSGVANDYRFLMGKKYTDEGLTILDMPFSFIADTIVLPYTIYRQVAHGNLCNKTEACCD